MRVKRLEIQGFKSFKDKTVIHFDHGITGIVGPNGCGKSNIVDAFFWVMGEQSYKHMRGSSSDDLIFNGSAKYAPLGIAEATMVLETDAVDADPATGATTQDIPVHLRSKEVSVTRRLYRTGEGEYFINGVPARLKDIHELFMDTGVGAKGYSVIEQGQIGKIVNAKPEERRLLIEEAGGIAKYKARKKESLRKMEATQANLSRLNDIVQEIERNLGSLERQAQKAKLYRKYKDELLDKEMTWGRRKNQVLRQKVDSLKKEKEALEQELIGLRAELQTAENAIEVDRISQLTDTKLAEELQTKVQQLSDELTRERSALDLSRRRQNDLASQIGALETERTELQTSIEQEKNRLSGLESEVAQAIESFESAAGKAQIMDEQARKARQEAEAVRKEVEEARRELVAGVSQSAELNSRAASLLTRMESAQSQVEKLNQQAQAQNEKVAAVQEEINRITAELETSARKREELQSERKEQSQQVQTQEQQLRQLERQRDEALATLTQLRSKLQSLEELAQAHEGFGAGAKAALDWAKSQDAANQLTALAHYYDVSAENEAALQGWLENRVEDLICEQPEFALAALNEIQTNKQGRATIHLATALSAQNAASYSEISAMLSGAGFEVAGELSQFVQVGSTLSAHGAMIAANMIANVCVVKNLAAVQNFIADGKIAELKGWSVVSQGGEVLMSNGSLRGGSLETEGSAHIMRRKRNIAELQEQVAQAEQKHQQIEAEVAQAKQALDLARARMQTLQADIQAIEVQSAGLNRDIHQTKRALQEAQSQLRYIEEETRQMQEEADSAKADRAVIELQVAEIAASRTALEEKIADQDSSLITLEAEARAQESELQALRVHEASVRERSTSLRRELEAGKTLIADRERRLAEIARTFERASSEQQQFSGGETELEEKIEGLTRAVASAKEELSAVKDKIEQSSAKLNSTLERIKELHKTGDAKNAQGTQLALEIEKLSGDLAHLIQNLEEKYGPGCLERPSASNPIQEEMTEPVVTAEMTAEEEQLLGEEVEKLRDRIRRLGEVNVMAIEEYEELKKRYDHLLTEKGDLERSIENLKEAIEHINKTSEDRFKKAFEAIADRFERLFPIIFGGGSAKLTLIYPEGSTDILEAGVDILAQPPGKKVSNITLLSGGEKALTAVSLIFAIFMVKPSPFCVLDEVDAPLDDANIGKFNALLREMSAKSQFILITHNKKTMELNDTLYGVTMEEPGVSKMVSIEMH